MKARRIRRAHVTPGPKHRCDSWFTWPKRPIESASDRYRHDHKHISMWAAVWHNGFDPQIMAQGAIEGIIVATMRTAWIPLRYVGSGFVKAPQEVSTR
jgi:hypothetical protein